MTDLYAKGPVWALRLRNDRSHAAFKYTPRGQTPDAQKHSHDLYTATPPAGLG